MFLALAALSCMTYAETYKVTLPFVEREPSPFMVNLRVGRYGSMPIPTGQRRKLKKWRTR